MIYNQPFDQPTNPNASFVNGNPATGTPGSIPSAATFEQPQREIVNFIEDAGLTPSSTDLHQLAKAVQSGGVCFAADTGTANNMVAAFTPAITALTPGMVLRIEKTAAVNTGAVSLDVGTGANAVVRQNGGSTASGDLPASCIVEVCWTGSNWQIVNFIAGGSGTSSTVIQSIPYAPDTGTTNTVVATYSPAVTSYTAGLVLEVLIAHSNTGAATFDANGVGVKNITHRDGSALLANDITAGEVAILLYDGTQFQKIGLTPNVLTAPRTYYVDGALGSDSNDGLAAGSGRAFATIQKALNTTQLFNLNGFAVTINVADWVGNVYAPFVAGAINGAGTITIQGNSATPSHCEVHNTAGAAAVASVSTQYIFNGLKFTSAAGNPSALTPGAGVWSVAGGGCLVIDCEFGACADAHMEATGATISFGGNIIVSGSAPYHLICGDRSYGFWTGNPGPALNITTAITVTAFMRAQTNAMIAVVYSSITGAGNVSGAKFITSLNGVINTGGAGVSYLPGSVAGSNNTGGQFG